MREMLFVGTYTDSILFGTGEILESKGKGIHVLELDVGGKFHLLETITNVRNPSYLCLAPNKKFLYAVNELKSEDGQDGGFASAYAIENETGHPTLRFLNMQSTRGADPCHIAVNNAATHAYVSNFMSGSVCVFPILTDGSLGDPSEYIQYSGSSIDPRRQRSPHAHSLVFDKTQQRAFVPDLGTDKLMIYETDFDKGTLLPAQCPFLQVNPGDGPRFLEFHPNGKWAYLINELSSGITLLEYDDKRGTLVRKQIVSTLPEQFSGDNICADLHVTPGGDLLYASNRGHDSLVCFRINRTDGTLNRLSIIPSGGKTPRNFCVSASGACLVVANQDTDNLLSYRMNRSTGNLEKIDEIAIDTPVCVRSCLF